ncbi:FIST C-terminal domain-containing protein [candidate division KSB1 bacterium]|nr:FIST C-terminal domain-containing protein [candidate division KSB1 bacterium]
MGTRVGVGYSENPKSFDAGVEAAKSAVAQAKISRCDLALLFSTSRHDPVQLRDGVRSIIGSGARLIGGYAFGIITNDRLGYDGYQTGIVVFSSDTIQVDMFIEGGLTNNEYNTGLSLGRQIKSKDYVGTPNIILMYDFVRGEPVEGSLFNKNFSTPIIEGIEKSIGTWPPAAGIGLLGDWQVNPTYQWFDDRIEQNTTMALVLSGGVTMDNLIMHGCKPSSDYYTVTKADNNTVLEMNGRPAVDIIAELLGPKQFKEWLEFPFFVILGINKGDKFSEFKEENYANRLISGVDQKRGGLIMFEPDLKVGTEVQLMKRSFSDFEYVRQRSEEILEQTRDKNPFFCFYIDCGGRASGYSGTEGEEAEVVQKVIGSKMPLFGIYSGTEIARVGNEMQACVFTGVLCVFCEQEK